MTDKIQKVKPNFLANLPKDDSMDALKEYRVLSRVRLTQGISPQEVKKVAGEGAALLQPGNVPLARPGEAFNFVPLLFFTEFISFRDRRDTGNHAIADRSFDPSSVVATKSRDADAREEEYSGGPSNKPWILKHTEILNFAGVIYGGELDSTPCVISFSKGEFRTGKDLCSAALLRKVEGVQVPLWAQVWRFTTNLRERGGNAWWGLDFSNPEDPWIKEDEQTSMHTLHEELRQQHDEQRLVVDREDSNEPVAPDKF